MTWYMDWIGTSGYNYPEWRGSFYPERFPPARMLRYYAERFPSVEINYTFYRMPTPAAVAAWAETVPDRFRFTLKAPRRITHIAHLKNCERLVESFAQAASVLGNKLGMVLFQLAPTHRKDLDALTTFLDLWPKGLRAAFEFRHRSWLEPDVLALLERKHIALCVADSERDSTPVMVTADVAYFRLRDQGYESRDLERWAQVIADATRASREVYIYFKHEESGIGPKLAAEFTTRLAAARAART